MTAEQGRDTSRPGRGRQHVRWGGRQVHLLTAAAPEAEPETEQLHGLARRDDCGAARRLLQGRSLADIRKLVRLPPVLDTRLLVTLCRWTPRTGPGPRRCTWPPTTAAGR